MDRKQIEWQREDYRAGIVGTLVANFSGFRGKESKTFQPNDFFPSLPRWTKRSRMTSDEHNKAVVKQLVAMQRARESAAK